MPSRSDYGEIADRAASVERTKELAQKETEQAERAGRRHESMAVEVRAAFESDQARLILEWTEAQLAKGLASLQQLDDPTKADLQRGKNSVYLHILNAGDGDAAETETWARTILARRKR